MKILMKNEINRYIANEYILVDPQKEFPKHELLDPVKLKERWGRR